MDGKEGRIPEAASRDRLAEHAQRLRDDALDLGRSLEVAAHDVEGYLEDQLHTRPYVTLAAAAGAGYVLGAGIPRGLAGFFTGVTVRLAAGLWVGAYLVDALDRSAAPATGRRSAATTREGGET